MRVLSVGNMYPPHYLGGYEIVWQRANAHLRAAGHSVRVLTTDVRFPAAEGADEEPDVHRELRWYWRDHEFPRLSPLERLRLERHNARTLDRHVEAFQPDAVCWWGLGGMSLSLVERVRRRGLPAVGMVGDDWMIYGPEVDGWLRMTRRAGAAGRVLGLLAGVPTRVDLDRAGHWIFASEHQRAVSGAKLTSASVAHSGPDIDRFPPAPPEPWRWRLLYVGRIDPRKGTELAVRVLPHLPPDAVLRMVGGGDDAHLESLRRRADDLGVAGRVEFAQRPHEEIAAEYAAADALLFPVLWNEPWGLVPLEAMAVGRPVVATGRGGSAEYLEDGRNCLLFDPEGGPEALARAVRRLAGDEGLRRRLAEGGRRTAERLADDPMNEAVLEALEAAAAR